MIKNKLLKSSLIFGALFSLVGCGGYDTESADTSYGVITDFVQDNLNNQKTNELTEKAKSKGQEWLDKGANFINDKINEYTEDTSTSEITDTSFTPTYEFLSQLEWENGTEPIYTINENKSTLDINDWTAPYIEYSDLDEYNRTGVATAYLQEDSYGESSSRSDQRWKPTGFQNQSRNVDGKKKYPYDRGHLIAYTLSFNFNDDGVYSEGFDGSLDNPKNLFTQTSYSNRTLLQRYEREVRATIQTGEKVIYRVEPVFRDDELVARGLWVQATSEYGSVDFNQYIFNVEPGIAIDYSTGNTKVNSNISIPKN